MSCRLTDIAGLASRTGYFVNDSAFQVIRYLAFREGKTVSIFRVLNRTQASVIFLILLLKRTEMCPLYSISRVGRDFLSFNFASVARCFF